LPVSQRDREIFMTPFVRMALVGAAGWALATVGLRLLPAWPQPSWAMAPVVALLLAGLVVLVGLLVRNLPPERRAAGAAAVALPGMIGDAVATALFAQTFPNAPPLAAGPFAALMLLGYATILAGGFVAARR